MDSKEKRRRDMPMKNYRTTVPAEKTIGQIQGILAKHGVRRMMLEYDESGNAIGLAFVIELVAFNFQHGLKTFKPY